VIGTMRNVKTKYNITNENDFTTDRVQPLLSRLSISPKVKRESKKTNPPICVNAVNKQASNRPNSIFRNLFIALRMPRMLGGYQLKNDVVDTLFFLSEPIPTF
jgi:hypothetical protein